MASHNQFLEGMLLDSQAPGTPPEPQPPTKRVAKRLVKTRFCKHYLRGHCKYQDKCAYAHQAEELMPRPNLVKTKMCVSFLSGACMNNECTYAHGFQELRQASHQETLEIGSEAAMNTREGWLALSQGSLSTISATDGALSSKSRHAQKADVLSQSSQTSISQTLMSDMQRPGSLVSLSQIPPHQLGQLELEHGLTNFNQDFFTGTPMTQQMHDFLNPDMDSEALSHGERLQNMQHVRPKRQQPQLRQLLQHQQQHSSISSMSSRANRSVHNDTNHNSK